jgi:hypothetical protein
VALVADHIDAYEFRHAFAVYILPDFMSMEFFCASTHGTAVLTSLNQLAAEGAPTLLSHPVGCPKILEMQGLRH